MQMWKIGERRDIRSKEWGMNWEKEREIKCKVVRKQKKKVRIWGWKKERYKRMKMCDWKKRRNRERVRL